MLIWLCSASFVLLLLVAPTLAWLTHSFLSFRKHVEARLATLSSPPASPLAAAPAPQLPAPSAPDPMTEPLQPLFGPDAARGSSPTPPPVVTRSRTTWIPRR